MIFVYFLLILLFGWFTVSLFRNELTVEEHIGLSILVGSGLHSVFYAIILRVFFYAPNNLLVLLLETVIVFFITLRRKIHITDIKIRFENGWLKAASIVLILISTAVFLYIFAQSIYWPVYEPDALYLYDFRAKLLMGGEITSFFKGLPFYQNYLYPPFTSLTHFFIYQAGNVNPKIIYPVILTAFYLIALGFIRRKTESAFLGLLGTTLILISPSIMWNSFLAFTNIIYTCFLSGSALYLFENIADNKLPYGKIVLGSVLLTLSIWTRAEPFWIVVILAFGLCALLKKHIVSIFIVLIIVVPICYLWTGSQIDPASYVIESNDPVLVAEKETKTALSQNIIQSSNVLQYFSGPLYESWGIAGIAFFGFVLIEILFFPRKFTPIHFVTILLAASLILGILNFAYRYPDWRGLYSSFYRIATIVVPLFWVSVFTSHIWRINKR